MFNITMETKRKLLLHTLEFRTLPPKPMLRSLKRSIGGNMIFIAGNERGKLGKRGLVSSLSPRQLTWELAFWSCILTHLEHLALPVACLDTSGGKTSFVTLANYYLSEPQFP